MERWVQAKIQPGLCSRGLWAQKECLFFNSHKGNPRANSSRPAGPLGILTAPTVLATHTAGPLSHMLPCLVTQLVPRTKLVISITPPALIACRRLLLSVLFFPTASPIPIS